MSERYSRLFTLPDQLYVNGSPVVIVAGALLKDNRENRLVAQLKFRNIQPLIINSLTVRITPYDPADRETAAVTTYNYLDLLALRDEEFGQKEAIVIPDSTVRSFTVEVTEVIFANKDVWKSEGKKWERLQPPVLIESVLKEPEQLKEYYLQNGNACKYEAFRVNDLWYCTCGELNKNSESICHSCRRNASDFIPLDILDLSRKTNERLKAEADKRAAEAEKQAAEAEKQAIEAENARIKRKHNLQIAKKIAAIMAFVLAGILLITLVIVPATKRNAADKLFAAEDYDAAMAAYIEIGDQEKVTEVLMAKEYKNAMGLVDSGDLLDAYNSLLKIDSEEARNSLEALKEDVYLKGLALIKEEQYSDANDYFSLIDEYKDSKEQDLFCRYKLGLEQFENKNFESAHYYFRDVPEKLLGIDTDMSNYNKLCETAIEYQGALDVINSIDKSYIDSSFVEKLEDAISQYATLHEEGVSITGQDLPADKIHMVDMYYFYSKYENNYFHRTGAVGHVTASLYFSKGNEYKECGYWFLVVEEEGSYGSYSKDILKNGSLSGKFYTVSEDGTSITYHSPYSDYSIVYRLFDLEYE